MLTIIAGNFYQNRPANQRAIGWQSVKENSGPPCIYKFSVAIANQFMHLSFLSPPTPVCGAAAHSLGVGGARAAIVKHSNSSPEAVSRCNQNLHIRMILSALLIYAMA